MDKGERIKQYKNSVAVTFSSLSLGTFGVSLIGDIYWATVSLIVFGVFFALCGIYIKFPRDLKQKWFIKKVASPRNMDVFRGIGWFIVLIMFGYSLTQTDILWQLFLGIFFGFLAYSVMIVIILRSRGKPSV